MRKALSNIILGLLFVYFVVEGMVRTSDGRYNYDIFGRRVYEVPFGEGSVPDIPMSATVFIDFALILGAAWTANFLRKE